MEKCNHQWITENNKIKCSICDKSELLLHEIGIEGLREGIKKNGMKYSVRDNRNRYFYPHEWNDFISKVSNRNKIIFELLLITGGRIKEILMIKKEHIKFENKFVILYNTKVKAIKQERKSIPRYISLTTTILRKLKEYTKNMNDNNYIFLKNYEDIEFKEIKNKIASKKVSNVYQIFKRVINKTSILDKYNFSLHNIRKTSGMWLKCLNIKESEICLRLGHDMNTYLKHYGSPDIFSPQDKTQMMNYFRGIYGL